MSAAWSVLETPLYRASYSAAIRRFFRKYATFTGRASRSEFWWWILTSAVVGLALNTISGLATGDWRSTLLIGPAASAGEITLGAIALVFGLGTVIPTLAVVWRRLHDANLSGNWFFITVIPVAGVLILLVLTAFDSDPDGARFDIPTVTRLR